MDFSRNAKHFAMGKPDKKSAIWTVNMRCFNLTIKIWELQTPPIHFFSKFEVN